MPDPFSIAGGAIALAGTGFKIGKGIKEYVDSVNGAEKTLRPIQLHVEFLAGLLNEVGTILESDGVRDLCTPGLFSAAKSALDNCSGNFKEIESFLAGIITVEGGKVKMNTFNKFTLAFKQTELDILQAHMDRSKADLNVVFTVLQAANALRSAPKDSTIVEERKAKVQASISAQRNNISPPSDDTTANFAAASPPSKRLTRDLQHLKLSDASEGLSATPKEAKSGPDAIAASESFLLYPPDEWINQCLVATESSSSMPPPTDLNTNTMIDNDTREGAANSTDSSNLGLSEDSTPANEAQASVSHCLTRLSLRASALHISSKNALDQWRNDQTYDFFILQEACTEVQQAYDATQDTWIKMNARPPFARRPRASIQSIEMQAVQSPPNMAFSRAPSPSLYPPSPLDEISILNYDDFGLGCVRSWPGTPVAADTSSDSPLPTPTAADDAGRSDVPDFSEVDQLLKEWTTLEI